MKNNKGNDSSSGSISPNTRKPKSKGEPRGILGTSIIIRGRWKTLSRLGQGAFGEIYCGIEVNTCDEVAIKVERADSKKMFLKLETFALRKLQSSPQVVRYISSGKQDHFNFLIMERLGENLAQVRKKQPNGKFSLSSTIKLGIQMIDSLESVHNLGYLHRDIKPSNFCIGKKKIYQVFLIDFNLARRFTLSTGAIRPPRKRAGFRGTARYASFNAHLEKELSRRDDLWSVFYVLVEFTIGDLPWKGMKDKKRIGAMKEKFMNFEIEITKKFETEFTLMMKHLKGLRYEDQPNYDFLRQQLYHLYNRQGFQPNQPMDWEEPVDNNPQRRHSLAEQVVAEQFFQKNFPDRKKKSIGPRRHSVEPILSRKDQIEFEKFLKEREKAIKDEKDEKEKNEKKKEKEEVEGEKGEEEEDKEEGKEKKKEGDHHENDNNGGDGKDKNKKDGDEKDEKNGEIATVNDKDTVFYSSYHPSNVRISDRWGAEEKKKRFLRSGDDEGKLCCCNIL